MTTLPCGGRGGSGLCSGTVSWAGTLVCAGGAESVSVTGEHVAHGWNTSGVCADGALSGLLRTNVWKANVLENEWRLF